VSLRCGGKGKKSDAPPQCRKDTKERRLVREIEERYGGDLDILRSDLQSRRREK